MTSVSYKCQNLYSLSLSLPPYNIYDKHRVMACEDARTLRQVVELPDGVRRESWIALNLMDFYQRISVIYGTVCHACTDVSCPKMTGGPKFVYRWSDEKHVKPQSLSAPQV